MKLDIREIPEEGIRLELLVDEKTVNEVAGEGPGDPRFLLVSPVQASLNIMRAGSMITVDGSLKAVLSFNCSRCLREFDYIAGSAFSLYFARRGQGEEEREKKLAPEDVEINFLEGNVLDATEIVLEQFALYLPMQPVCKDDCKGLCPRCGGELNLGSCGCKKDEKTDPRFACLKGFKV